MDIEISRFEKSDASDWTAFVRTHENSTVFHTLEWKKVLEDTYQLQPEYLVARNNSGMVVGISPAFLMQTLTGLVLVSQPFFEYGSPLIKWGCNDALSGILKYYIDLKETLKIKYIELRPVPDDQDDIYTKYGFAQQCKAFDYCINIEGKDYERDIWNGLYTKKSRVRNSVRHAKSQGLEITEKWEISHYYDLYLKTMEQLGSIPHSKKLFDNIKKKLDSSAVRFTYANYNETPVAAMMSFPFQRRNLMVGLVSDTHFQHLHGNDLLYNEQIEYSVRNNFSIVDMGRTRPNSPYEQFKKKWGATRIKLYSYVFPPAFRAHANPYTYYLKFSRFTKAVPWIFTRTGIGPYLSKRFP